MQPYVDPGSGALVWQMLMAACIGLLFYLRRMISWLAHANRVGQAGTRTREQPENLKEAQSPCAVISRSTLRLSIGLRWSDLAFSVSLANLCYLTVWRDLQNAADDDLNYFREAPLSDTVLVTLVSVALLSTGFVGVTLALRRWARGVPLVRAARGIVLLLAPLLPLLLAQQAIFAVRSPPEVFRNSRPALSLPGTRAGRPRVVWLVFDELDERLAFRERPTDVKLPAFDWFRDHVFRAMHAVSPARWTLVSLPALICGTVYSEGEPVGPNELRLTVKSTGQRVRWSEQDNVFSDAKAIGLNTGIVGFVHPYAGS